jgi:phosphatidate cytidylyltransferase
MLIKRTLTAIILIPLVLLAIFRLPQHLFEGLLGLIMLGCAWEWTGLMAMTSLLERFTYLLQWVIFCMQLCSVLLP